MSEKKLIVDEDWKSQVQAEKAAAGEVAAATGQTSDQQGLHSPQDLDDFPLPPASLELLVTTLATETLVSLGQIPHPATGQAHVHRSQAQYLIDTIDVLRQKTKGNLTPDEQQMFESILHQLRMVFVETGAAPQSTATIPAGNIDKNH
jgi:hypothetical protein